MGRLRPWALLVLLVAGCGRPDAPAGTGAREAALGYYEALVRQDWAGAYDALHPDSRRRTSQEQFARLAGQHRQGLGFEPREAHVRACEEHGEEAVAHVTLTGPGKSGQVRYRDAVSLRRGEGGWGVVLPSNFGQAKPR